MYISIFNTCKVVNSYKYIVWFWFCRVVIWDYKNIKYNIGDNIMWFQVRYEQWSTRIYKVKNSPEVS